MHCIPTMAFCFTTPRVFRERMVPPDGELVGYAALAHAYGLDAPVRSAACILPGFLKGGRQSTGDWTLFEKRYQPEASLAGHLTFALRHEPLDLLLLKRLFDATRVAEMVEFVVSQPTGAWGRRSWFLFEWLTGQRLPLPDARTGNYVEALDPALYVTATAVNSPRHRVRDNLPGTPAFCPVLRRTPTLAAWIERELMHAAQETTSRADKRLLSRAASFLLLADSQASFQIEGERPPRNRIERWGRAVLQAGQRPLSVAELERLQSVLIEDSRHVHPGLRREGVFLGDRTPDGLPVPEFIGARSEDLPALLEGLLVANARMGTGEVDPVLQAAAIAFGFVMVHPFEDGNGRLHRFLVHHVLAERRFSPPGLVFPVSSVLLDEIGTYGEILRAHSGPLMDHIDWQPTARGNVEVLNDTRDLYAYPDVTAFAEFLYTCVARTVEQDLPRELRELAAYDQAKAAILARMDMADARVSLLITLVRQNGGTLSRRRRDGDFADLTEEEAKAVEQIVQEAYALPP
jgi:Fic family protein